MTFPITLIFMFLVFWRPQEWLVPWLYGWPLLDAIIYVALLSLIMEVNQGVVRQPRTPVIWLASGLWVATILSHAAHTYYQGIADTIPESFKLCFFLVLLVVVIDRIERIQAVILVMVASGIIIAAHCLLQQKTGHGFAGQPPIWRYRPITDEWQIQSLFFGIFGDPNDAGQWLAAAIPLVFAVPRRYNPLSFMVCVAVAYVLFLGLTATHSRGAQIAFAAEVIALFFLWLPVRWLPYAAIAGLIGGLALCATRGAGMLDASAQERVVFWGLANRAFKANPIFGLGYGMFWQVTSGSRAAHNAFVTCYTEVGVLGYWFWFSILQLGVIGAWRTRSKFSRPKRVSELYLKRASGLGLVALIGFSVGGYFLSRAFAFPFFFLFGLLNAMPLVAARYLPEKHPPLIQTTKHVLGMGTLTTIFSILYVYATILILNKAFYG
jgi:hypothetical protein